jgi:hypothetical protein
MLKILQSDQMGGRRRHRPQFGGTVGAHIGKTTVNHTSRPALA